MLNYLKQQESFSTVECAIIGSGSHQEKKHGNIIDNIPIVIRFNNFIIQGYEEYIGSKTNIWCFSDYAFREIKNNPNHCDQIWIISRFNAGVSKKVKEIEQRAPINIISKQYEIDLRDILKAQPSTGIIAIKYATGIFKTPIFIKGFSNFDKEQPFHYYAPTHRACSHDGWAEKQLIQQWHDEGLLIS